MITNFNFSFIYGMIYFSEFHVGCRLGQELFTLPS